MNNSREIVCIVCPNGCRMNVIINEQNEVTLVENALCSRGQTYTKDEIQNPKRSLTSTIRVVGGTFPLVSVRSDRPIPKAMIQEALIELRKLELEAPINYHQVIIKDLLGTGANIITTKQVLKKEAVVLRES
jgi:CxxC motif-containing protein